MNYFSIIAQFASFQALGITDRAVSGHKRGMFGITIDSIALDE